MAVANKRYCIDDSVINYTDTPLLWSDAPRHAMYNYILANTGIKALVDKIYTYKRIGKDTICLHEEIAFLQGIAALFLIIKEEESGCSSVNRFETIKEDYKLDCIREALACRYGKGGLIEELVEELGLNSANNGIGYMTIQSSTATGLCSPFQPTQPN